MNFQCFDILTSGVVIYLGIDWSQTPAHLTVISTKSRVQLVDPTKNVLRTKCFLRTSTKYERCRGP